MSATLKVQSYHSTSRGGLYGYALKVSVTEAVDISPAIFVFRRELSGDYTFVCVADPVDLEEVPVSSAELSDEVPNMRTDSVTLYFRSALDREETETAIHESITGLVQAVTAMGQVALKEWRIVGDPYVSLSELPVGAAVTAVVEGISDRVDELDTAVDTVSERVSNVGAVVGEINAALVDKLGTSDFAALSTGRPATVEQLKDVVVAILKILKGVDQDA